MKRLRPTPAISALIAATVLAAIPARAFDLPGRQPGDNVVLQWNEALIQAIRDSKPGPTVVSRAIAVVHTCVYDAWAAYDAVAEPTRPARSFRRPSAERTDVNRAAAVSFAAYRALSDLFPKDQALYDGLMADLGYDVTDSSFDRSRPSGVGNSAAAAVLLVRHADGSNQLNGYADTTGYVPVNPPDSSGLPLVDPNRWQPLDVFDGISSFNVQKFTTPQWGLVAPFALTSGSQFRPPEPVQYPSSDYTEQAQDLLDLSANLTDEQKTTAEYFADGPGSPFPPGHWCLFGQFVSRRDAHGLGDDVRMFFAIGNAVLDAGITAWDAKRLYDSVRPITAIHFLFAGQQVLAWAGPGLGTRMIDGASWRPYQLATVVTPPFPEFFSGHSVFSAAAAEVLKSFTGSDAFGFSVVIPKGSSFGEPGIVPASDLTLAYATYSSAADAAGMSRRWGGIHFTSGDLTGRFTGRLVGALVWQKAVSYFSGTEAGFGVVGATSAGAAVVGGRP